MKKTLKLPLFLLRLFDAFILRMPLAILVVVGVTKFLLGEAGVEAKSNAAIIWVLAFAFAFVQAFLFVTIHPRRTPSQKTTARIWEVLFSLLLLAVVAVAVRQQIINLTDIRNITDITLPVLIKFFKANIFILVILAWILYVVVSETVKGKADRKRNRRVPASKNSAYLAYSEIACVHNALNNLKNEQDDKRFDSLMRSSDELLKRIDQSANKKATDKSNKQQPKKPQTKNVKIASGDRVGIDFFDSDTMKLYKKYILSNHIVICVAGNGAFVVKLITKNGDYRQAEDCWYRNDSRTGDYTAELANVIRTLKSKCGIAQVRGVIAKAFAGGSIKADNSYEIIDVSSSYDLLEKEIKLFVPAENADKQLTAACAKAVKKEFSNRFAVEKKEVR